MKLLLFLFLTFPVFIFAQNKPDTASKSSDKDAKFEKVDDIPVFLVAEENPEYPGGQGALTKFLAANIEYPLSAKKNAVQGTVYVTFVITEKGELIDIKVARGKGGGLDEEAVRVVKMMPLWKPGKIRGKPVRCAMTLPVQFSLL